MDKTNKINTVKPFQAVSSEPKTDSGIHTPNGIKRYLQVVYSTKIVDKKYYSKINTNDAED